MALWSWRNPDIELTHPDREIPHLELSPRSAARYALDRLTLAIDRRRHPAEQPWLTRDAITLLTRMLNATDVGLEFGSGSSTIWLARQTGAVTAVEAFDQWHQPLVARLEQAGIANARVLLVSARDLGYETREHKDAYISVCPELEAESLDYVLVDGEYRDDTALRAVSLLKTGGLLILDNANAYLPNDARSPWVVSRPVSVKWEKFLDEVSGWRHIWTTNGVWDTAIWIKP